MDKGDQIQEPGRVRETQPSTREARETGEDHLDIRKYQLRKTDWRRALAGHFFVLSGISLVFGLIAFVVIANANIDAEGPAAMGYVLGPFLPCFACYLIAHCLHSRPEEGAAQSEDNDEDR